MESALAALSSYHSKQPIQQMWLDEVEAEVNNLPNVSKELEINELKQVTRQMAVRFFNSLVI